MGNDRVEKKTDQNCLIYYENNTFLRQMHYHGTETRHQHNRKITNISNLTYKNCHKAIKLTKSMV